ncbi:hypothetical protein PPYR_03272 [Photinus pyralis]|uniref:Methyltransferase domain-containing protein n=3 Tax=Photinus pyralis TaxID=7054 RepID=A0A1Y1K5R2_PHOPY|nr:juvenile hormone acid O-methyltransferase-like [Photinus pyralis]KAB0791472.1 hypothetical protein PPYR_03272 [Photinus pyralis]
MDRATVYVKQSKMSEMGAEQFIKQILETATWRDNCNVLDVGCGPGNVTHDYILPILPIRANSIVAIDKKANLVDYANEHYGKKSKIQFKTVDIVKDVQTLDEYVNHFDHIFSFYCLQSIREQETALRNIFKILKPGGDFYFSCDAQTNLYEGCEYLLGTPEWEPVLRDYKETMSPFHDSESPAQDLEELLTKIGFQSVYVTMERQEFLIPMEDLPEFVVVQTPFDIPPEFEEKFGQACVDTARTLKLNRFVDGQECCYLQLQLLFGHQRKPIASAQKPVF